MLSLYVHIPFCVKKCPYCGFYSTPYGIDSADEFIAALRSEAAGYKTEFSDHLFHSVYIGGGTPTALNTRQLSEVLTTVRSCFEISEDAEFTVEANPNTITREHLGMLREKGANRLSLGVQAFSDEVLRTLGRLHTSEEAERTFSLARSAGFQNIGMDLMYGIPGQTMAQWEDTLKTSIRCRPEHVSVYSLSVDDGSLFHQLFEAGNFECPDDDSAAEMYVYAISILKASGYRRYEISNLSLPGFECRHNKNYWDRGEFLGLGPAAWSFISQRRHYNIADTAEYVRRTAKGISPIADSEQPGPIQASQETLLLSLRTVEGLDLQRYRNEYGDFLLEQLERNIAPLMAAGLLEVNEGRATLTQRGILLANEALVRLSA
jgi:oxygen-independent coproporphyrinogen-3 oxidase